MQTPAQTPKSSGSFIFGRRTGAPLAVITAASEEIQLTPESLVLLVHARYWGFVWNWPIAVNITRGGQIERKLVVDLTRLALWVLGLSAALLSVFLLKRKEQT